MRINGHRLYLSDIKESPSLSPWIHHQSSLTDKLYASTGSTELELISQKWTKPNWWDRTILLTGDCCLYQREILMKSQSVAYWYARTVIPEPCFALNPSLFKRLEHESIRNILFNTPGVYRTQMLTYPVDHNCIEFFWAKKYLSQTDTTLWVRYSEYLLQDKEPFYLMELLFPELERL